MGPSEYEILVPVKIDKTLGYAYFLDRGHPLANGQGKVYAHRHFASVKLGRWIGVGEHVHHKNENRSDNALSNLEVETNSEHAKEHAILRRERRPPPTQLCPKCGTATRNKTFCSRKCSRKADRPSRAELISLIQALSWRAIGQRYGVSDVAVRGWARGYGLIPCTSLRPYRP